jgi:adenylate cyclase
VPDDPASSLSPTPAPAAPGEALPATTCHSAAPLFPGAAGEIMGWLLGPARCLDGPVLLDQLSRRLSDAGVPVWRTTLHLPKLHPQSDAVGFRWYSDGRCTETREVLRELRETDSYLDSPFAVLHATGQRVRCRLVGPEADVAYPICHELAAEGATDYTLLPMGFGRESRAVLGMTTKAEGGFTDDQMALVEQVLPVLSATAEILMGRQTTSDLLHAYLGKQAARRILDGQVLLGKGIRLNAVLLVCDMRDFAHHMETLPRSDLGDLMRDYFASVVEAIHDAEGDVLKFMGDGLLAIFPVEDGEEQEVACVRALMAAQKAFANLDGMNAERAADGRPTCDAGIALHVGEMFYGNIGAGARLDFTVMGPAVNRASRIEGLCRPIGERILTSAEFAALCPVQLVSAGRHALKGIAGEQEIFVPLMDDRALGLAAE